MNFNMQKIVCCWPVCLLLLGLVLTVGCDDGRPDLVPVSGQVLIDGKPLKFGSIRISPSDARSASGKLDEEGRFTLKTFEDGDGVLLGKHQASVSSGEYVSEPITFWHAPEKYNRSATSGLTVDIEGPTDALVVELSWDGDKPHRTYDGKRMKN